MCRIFFIISLICECVIYYDNASPLTTAYKVSDGHAVLSKTGSISMQWSDYSCSQNVFLSAAFIGLQTTVFKPFSVSFCKHTCCVILMKALEHHLERSHISLRFKLLPHKMSCKYYFQRCVQAVTN